MGKWFVMVMKQKKMEEISATAALQSVKETVTLRLSRLAYEALAGKNGAGSERAAARLEDAIRVYLSDKGSDQPAWPYPAFLRGSEVREDVELELNVGDELWRQFEEEAREQDVSVQQLSEHAAFYLAAELDAGRITQRILDDLQMGEAEA